jgi:hypothetical protein
MKRISALIALAFATSVQAQAPHLYGNVEDVVTHCGMVLDGAPKITAPIVPGTPKQCKFSVSAVSVGPHTVTLTAIIMDPAGWVTEESAPSAPFLFTRPATPVAPTTLRLGM